MSKRQKTEDQSMCWTPVYAEYAPASRPDWLWSYDGVRPGLLISVAGLARHSFDFRLARDL